MTDAAIPGQNRRALGYEQNRCIQGGRFAFCAHSGVQQRNTQGGCVRVPRRV